MKEAASKISYATAAAPIQQLTVKITPNIHEEYIHEVQSPWLSSHGSSSVESVLSSSHFVFEVS